MQKTGWNCFLSPIKWNTFLSQCVGGFLYNNNDNDNKNHKNDNDDNNWELRQ